MSKPSDNRSINGVSSDILKAMYVTMLRIRLFEEGIIPFLNNEIKCPVHLYIGQEAVAAGVCANLQNSDYVFSTHRSHGHYIAKGGDINTLMAEMYGKASGCSKGRGGSMHLASPEIGLPGSPAIVAGSIPLACGSALTSVLRKSGSISVCFFGDGATNEGVFYESLNFAALKKLPVIFVCENNLYATHMPVSSCLSDTAIYRKAKAFNMPGRRIDGNDVMEVFLATEEAIASVRSGGGPFLLECMTYRWHGHVGPGNDVGEKLRSQEELNSWMNKCPIKTFEQILSENRILSSSEMSSIRAEIKREVQDAVTFAEEVCYPDSEELLECLFR
ncbi:MAG: thiamine pyrophosphate-dependent dehydrogenase E1 component subunit alpha [Dehalococcoidales bacterium]|nr:thiamine pyrophosphate-dependent dehydrogenase E1 component subunit alpha [Dehalococcoidales bacterium]